MYAHLDFGCFEKFYPFTVCLICFRPIGGLVFFFFFFFKSPPPFLSSDLSVFQPARILKS